MKTSNPVIIQFKNTTDVDILARIDFYLGKGSFLNLGPNLNLSAHKDENKKNKFIIEEILSFQVLDLPNKIPLGHIILRLVPEQTGDIYEVEIFRNDKLPSECKGGAFLRHLAIALCEDFTLVDPSKKIIIPTVDPESDSFMYFDEPSPEEMEPNKNTNFILENEDLLSESSSPPWEKIDDHGADREILRLWHMGHTNGEISKKVSLSKLRITNIIYELRKKYGEEIAPKDIDRRKHKKTRDIE